MQARVSKTIPIGSARSLPAKYEVDEAGCWLWNGYVMPNGYGRAWDGEKVVYAHRLSYEVAVAPIPEGLQIDHICRVRRCVNPAHLEPVTPRENVMRGESWAARHVERTHCPQGHPYDDANTYVWRERRQCRTCRAQRDRARRAA